MGFAYGLLTPPAQYRPTLNIRPGLANPVTVGPTPPAGTPQSTTAYPAAQVAVPTPSWVGVSGAPVTVQYWEAGSSIETEVEGFGLGPIEIYMGQNAVGPAVPGSVRFVFRGRTYVDRSGSLVYGVDPATNAGTVGGTFDYQTCKATVTDYAAGSNTVTVVSLATRYVDPGVTGVFFRPPGSPLVPGQFTIRATTFDGTLLTGNADINGEITGDKMEGEVDWTTGLARLAFGERVVAAGNEGQPWYDAAAVDSNGDIWRPLAVDPATIFFGAVLFRRIPVDPELVGIDPVRLPSDGRVLGFNLGTVGVLSHTAVTTVTPEAEDVTDLGRTQISFVEVYDSSDPPEPIEDVWYTADLSAGTITWANPLNLSGYTMPVRIRHRIEHLSQIADVQITGQIGLQVPLPRNFPAGSVFSNALAYGDMQARVTNVFDQATWSTPAVWSDVVQGSPASGNYNTILHPIEVENDSATDDRWALVFQNTNTVLVLSEDREAMGPYSIGTDIAPVNPVSGKPYFTIRADGWGTGWAAGNALRFNTVSATRPTWAARVTLPGEITEPNDAVRINVYGNAN